MKEYNQINVCRINRPKMIKRFEMSGLKYKPWTHVVPMRWTKKNEYPYPVTLTSNARRPLRLYRSLPQFIRAEWQREIRTFWPSDSTEKFEYQLREYLSSWSFNGQGRGTVIIYTFYFFASDLMIYYPKVRPNQVRGVQFVDIISIIS